MAMDLVLCTLSSGRLKQLTEEPELLEEVLEAREEMEVPGLLEVGSAWDALDYMISERGRTALLGDAFLARSGEPFGPAMDHGRGRLLAPARVRQVSQALDALPENVIEQRFKKLHGRKIHGGYGQQKVEPDDPRYLREKTEQERMQQIQALTIIFERVRELYRHASEAGHSMLAIVV